MEGSRDLGRIGDGAVAEEHINIRNTEEAV